MWTCQHDAVVVVVVAVALRGPSMPYGHTTFWSLVFDTQSSNVGMELKTEQSPNSLQANEAALPHKDGLEDSAPAEGQNDSKYLGNLLQPSLYWNDATPHMYWHWSIQQPNPSKKWTTHRHIDGPSVSWVGWKNCKNAFKLLRLDLTGNWSQKHKTFIPGPAHGSVWALQLVRKR